MLNKVFRRDVLELILKWFRERKRGRSKHDKMLIIMLTVTLGKQDT